MAYVLTIVRQKYAIYLGEKKKKTDDKKILHGYHVVELWQ